MNEEDFRRELARKDAMISDLASQITQMNSQLAELAQKQEAAKKPPEEQTPAPATLPCPQGLWPLCRQAPKR